MTETINMATPSIQYRLLSKVSDAVVAFSKQEYSSSSYQVCSLFYVSLFGQIWCIVFCESGLPEHANLFSSLPRSWKGWAANFLRKLSATLFQCLILDGKKGYLAWNRFLQWPGMANLWGSSWHKHKKMKSLSVGIPVSRPVGSEIVCRSPLLSSDLWLTEDKFCFVCDLFCPIFPGDDLSEIFWVGILMTPKLWLLFPDESELFVADLVSSSSTVWSLTGYSRQYVVKTLHGRHMANKRPKEQILKMTIDSFRFRLGWWIE